jgi:RAB protein geranylgeranyltransferase component A
MCSHILQIITDPLPNMTLAIPEKLHKKMKRHSELKWSDIARQAFERKINEIEFMDKVLEKSELTEEDAERIGHAINASVRKRIQQRD